MENANPFIPVTPNRLHARITQELNELCAILAMIDSRLENIDHTQIIIPPPIPLEQLLNDFMNPPNVFERDDLESDDESIDTPLVSPFIDSDDELDDGEVLNELNKYGNVGNFYPNRRINCIGGCDLAFPCMIGKSGRFIGFSLGRFLDDDLANLSRFFSDIEQNRKSTRLGPIREEKWKTQHFKIATSILTPSPKVPRKWELLIKVATSQVVERRRKDLLLTLSRLHSHDVNPKSDGVTLADKEKPIEDSAG
ncbi:hypothetical protein Tco_1236798 [Tanacetum coccineum]